MKTRVINEGACGKVMHRLISRQLELKVPWLLGFAASFGISEEHHMVGW